MKRIFFYMIFSCISFTVVASAPQAAASAVAEKPDSKREAERHLISKTVETAAGVFFTHSRAIRVESATSNSFLMKYTYDAKNMARLLWKNEKDTLVCEKGIAGFSLNDLNACPSLQEVCALSAARLAYESEKGNEVPLLSEPKDGTIFQCLEKVPNASPDSASVASDLKGNQEDSKRAAIFKNALASTVFRFNKIARAETDKKGVFHLFYNQDMEGPVCLKCLNFKGLAHVQFVKEGASPEKIVQMPISSQEFFACAVTQFILEKYKKTDAGQAFDLTLKDDELSVLPIT